MSTAQALADLSFGSEEDDCGLPNVKNMAAKTDHNLWADPSADDVPVQNLWSDYSEDDPVRPAKILCRVHGVVCKKGICREYARQLKEADGNGNGAGRNKLQTKAGGVGRSTHGPDVVVRKAAPTWGPSGPPVSRPPSTISSASKGSIQAQGARGNPWGNVKQTAVGSGLGTQRTANVNANSRGGAWNAASGNSASGSSPWATIVKGPPADAWPGLNPQIPVPAKKAQPLQTRPAKAIVEKAPVVASGGDDAGWGDESQVW
ncbi:hypothetical protein OF83DRAFT_708065 [Amylostereum chailletii]|nr:hypothetical protein OF83DRAFT_708065 [Amylostereum chailletii]